jgi:hypothetical protein
MESLFVLWRVTRDSQYRRWGWAMLRAWERFCRVAGGGYASLNSVLQARVPLFWLPPDQACYPRSTACCRGKRALCLFWLPPDQSLLHPWGACSGYASLNSVLQARAPVLAAA